MTSNASNASNASQRVPDARRTHRTLLVEQDRHYTTTRQLQHIRVAEAPSYWDAVEALPRDTATQLVVHVHVSQFHTRHSLHYLALFVRSTLVRCVVGHT